MRFDFLFIFLLSYRILRNIQEYLNRHVYKPVSFTSFYLLHTCFHILILKSTKYRDEDEYINELCKSHLAIVVES